MGEKPTIQQQKNNQTNLTTTILRLALAPGVRQFIVNVHVTSYRINDLLFSKTSNWKPSSTRFSLKNTVLHIFVHLVLYNATLTFY